MANLHFNHFENYDDVYYIFRLIGNPHFDDETDENWWSIMVNKGSVTKVTMDPLARDDGCKKIIKLLSPGDDAYCFVVNDKPTVIKNNIIGGSIMWYSKDKFISGMQILDDKQKGEYVIGLLLDGKKKWIHNVLFPNDSHKLEVSTEAGKSKVGHQ